MKHTEPVRAKACAPSLRPESLGSSSSKLRGRWASSVLIKKTGGAAACRIFSFGGFRVQQFNKANESGERARCPEFSSLALRVVQQSEKHLAEQPAERRARNFLLGRYAPSSLKKQAASEYAVQAASCASRKWKRMLASKKHG